jgi:hypothetical protein
MNVVDFGEGSFRFELAITTNKDNIDFDTQDELRDGQQYYIKHDKVFRKCIPVPLLTAVDSNITVSINNTSPDIIMDLTKRLTYTLDAVKKRQRVYIDSLRNRGDEVLFKPLVIGSPDKYRILYADSLHPLKDTKGIVYYSGRGVCNDIDTFYFKFIKEEIPVLSPLNIYTPGLKGNVVAVRFPIKSTSNRPNPSSGIIRIFDILSMEVPDSLFTFPASTVFSHVPARSE